MITRQLFEVAADTGTWIDTGPAVNGALLQVRWNPTGTADTGADLLLSVRPSNGDTGLMWDILNDNDCLGVDFVRGLRQRLHGSDGAVDTGAGPIVLAGDRIRVKVTPGGTSAIGKLYIWTTD